MNQDNSDEQKGFGPEIEAVIKEVKKEFKTMLRKKKDCILALGKALEPVLKHDSICEEIKIILANEITLKIISGRLIEKYCLASWKKKTSPKRKEKINPESEKNSLSAREEMVATIDNSGNAILVSPDKPAKLNEEVRPRSHDMHPIDVTKTTNGNKTYQKYIEFEISIPFRELKLYLIAQQNSSNPGQPVIICGNLDVASGNVKSFSLGRNHDSTTFKEKV